MRKLRELPIPEPQHLRLVLLIEYDWRCPKCRTNNHSDMAHDTEYPRARCGKCHTWWAIDYRRSRDAPEAALSLDHVALGNRTTPPIENRSTR